MVRLRLIKSKRERKVDEVEVAKIEYQTTQYKKFTTSLKVKYRPPD